MAEDSGTTQPKKPATPSLQDIIARQRADLAKKAGGNAPGAASPSAKPEAAAPEPAKVPAPAADAKPIEEKPAAPAQPPAEPKPAEVPVQAETPAQPPAPAVVPAATAAPAPAAPVDPQREAFIRAAKEMGLDESEVDKLGPAERAMVEAMLQPKPAPAPEPKPAANTDAAADARAAMADLMQSAPPPQKRVNVLHMMLMFNTAAVAMVLLGVFWLLPTYYKPVPNNAAPVVVVTGQPQTAPATAPINLPKKESADVVQAVEEVDPNFDVAASWQTAQADYAQGKLGPALTMYRKLLANVPPQTADESFSRDFIRLRVAQCLIRLKQNIRALPHLHALSNSSSPIVRVVANYWLASIEVSSDQPMQARARALAASAVCGLLPGNEDLERDCQFLAAKALTVKTLAMYNAQANIDWGDSQMYDPFANLGERALRELLLMGSQRLAAATLGPQVRKTSVNSTTRIEAICAGSSLEDLLARVSAETGASVQYVNIPPSAKQRAVTLVCSGWPEQRVYEVACGSVGLVARFTGQEVQVLCADAPGSVNQERQVLLDECQAYWRRLLLRYSDDRRQALGNFVLAMVSEFSGDTLAAISQYQFTANRFAREKVAPEALLRSAKLRMSIRDFVSAKADLSSLLDNYSDYKATDQAYLALAQAMMESGMVAQAERTFHRIYQMEVPGDVRIAACLGAAQCAYRQGRPAEAVTWADRYIAKQNQTKGPELVEAFTLLGRSHQALKKPADAVGAYHLALAAQPGDKERIEVLLCLSDAQRCREAYTSALGALRQLEGMELTLPQQVESMTLTAKAYCAMGLPETAMDVLRHEQADLPEGPLKAQAALELSRCAQQAGKNQEAYDILQSVLDALKGPQSLTATLELADLCLTLEKPQQALTLTGGLLAAKDLEPNLAQRARAISAKAHMAMGDYDKAALAVAPQPAATTKPGEP